MSDFDAAQIVPSTRDLFQVIGTRKKSLAVVAKIEGDSDREAARLYDLDVSAFAFEAPGPLMQLGARSTKTVPSLSLDKIVDRDGCLRARYFGADGVAIDAALDPDSWDRLAKQARMTRMAALAFAVDETTMKSAAAAGARAVLLTVATADSAIAIAKGAASSITIVVNIEGCTGDDLRKLRGVADAAIVPSSLHRAPEFRALVSELDP